MQIELIKWVVSEPVNFSCFRCCSHPAEYKVRIEVDGVVYKPCLCEQCIRVPEHILIEELEEGW